MPIQQTTKPPSITPPTKFDPTNPQLILNDENELYLFKYLNIIIENLYNKKLLDLNDINKIKMKIDSKILTVKDVIESIEKLYLINKNINNNVDELPREFTKPIGDGDINNWSQDYTILNTSKWQVPIQRPPVCVSTYPCNICPIDSSTYPLNLLKWDESLNVTGSKYT
jgi:hypothetical protein